MVKETTETEASEQSDESTETKLEIEKDEDKKHFKRKDESY